MNPLLPLTICARKSGPGLLEAKHRLLAYLDQHAIPYQLENHPNTLKDLTLASRTTLALDQVKQGMLVSLGGDGSMLSLIPHAAAHHLPIIGINLGRVGFLTDLSMDHLSQLSAIVNGHYLEDKRQLLDAVHQQASSSKVVGIALNEVMIKAANPARNLAFTLTIGKQHFHHYADGFLIATPTGSTAYALSAGGPVIMPNADAHIMLPICSQKLNARAIVTPASQQACLTLDDRNHRLATLYVDGKKIMDLQPGDSIITRASSLQARLIHPEDYDFMQSAQQKLQWGA